MNVGRWWHGLLRVLAIFVRRLKRVPPVRGVARVLRRLLTRLFGRYEPPPVNPYYEELRALCDRPEPLTLCDVKHIVVPLLLTRGEQIAAIHEHQQRDQRRGLIEQRVSYVFVVGILVFFGVFTGRVDDVAQGNRTALRQLAQQQTQLRVQAREQREGRARSVATICAVQSAAIEAAIMALNQSVEHPAVVPGFPASERRRVARRIAREYARRISRAVEREARRSAPAAQRAPAARARVVIGTIVKRDGTLDCAKLARVSRVG